MTLKTSISRRIRSVRLEIILFSAGTIGLIYCLAIGAQMLSARQAAFGIVPAPVRADPASASVSPFLLTTTATGGRPAVVGRVEIPEIGLVTPLLSGDDSMSLAEGAGHIPGTAVPGGLGTVGIAGHRDTHFRQLGGVTAGMDVRLIIATGIFHYRVTSSEVVMPEQVSVLATGNVPGLVLVTCYPFRYIGHAPKRFIVHAELVSVAPDSSVNPSGK